jgi:hypothetical protein
MRGRSSRGVSALTDDAFYSTQLAERLAAFRLRDVPVEVVSHAKLILLDTRGARARRSRERKSLTGSMALRQHCVPSRRSTPLSFVRRAEPCRRPLQALGGCPPGLERLTESVQVASGEVSQRVGSLTGLPKRGGEA